MATEPKPRVRLPKTASAGEVIVVKTLISHDMESGQRRDSDGNLIPRQIINAFSCTFNGEPVFSCDLDSAVSANPYFEFEAKVNESGTFAFEWVDDDGSVYTYEQDIEVS